ncbi:MAG: PEP-CTERM sorting domain-containing protein [Thermoguttaceae bacterium]
MVTNHIARTRVNGQLQYGPPLTITFFLVLALGVFTWTAQADVWTGAGETPANQTRNWNKPLNWWNNAVPPANDQNYFLAFGEGTIELKGLQFAGAMVFDNFTYTTIAPGVPPLPGASNLTMVNSPNGVPYISMGEGVRDTYGVDYFTAGPKFTADVILAAPLSVNLGLTGNGSNSSMLFSGQITNPQNNPITYTGAGTGASLWISSNNVFNAIALSPINIAPGGGGGGKGYTMHLVDQGRMDNTAINLITSTCYLGLQDNRNGGPIPPLASNIYLNSVNSYGGNVYADRSYQSNPLDTTVNVEQYLAGGVTVYQGVANFGSTGPFGRTNNGFGLHLATLNWDIAPNSVTINVNNGNLTEGRGGSRYVSGANRLQEPNNYTYVSNLWENQSKLVPFIKGGSGVLVIDQANGVGQWWTSPQVNAGVLRLGTPTTPPQNAPSVILNTANAGVGIGWDTTVNLRAVPPQPLPIIPTANVTGQSGAIDVDLWNFLFTAANPTIDTNVTNNLGAWTYMRIGSSMGGDASFDPQPLAAIHASIAFRNNQQQLSQIIPYVVGPNTCNIYYFGGGGGTLQVDAQLGNYQQRNTMLEMGTTGTLLPGRVALNPGGDLSDGSNTYTGWTDICAGTLQLMKQNAVRGSASVHVWTYDTNITNGLYAIPSQYHNWWEGLGGYTWTGPGQLLLDPGRNGNANDWSLGWYTANGGQPLFNITPPNNFQNLFLDGGVIGWTGNVNVTGVPGTYGLTIISDLTGVQQNVNVLGLGGEYSAGTMFWQNQSQPQIGIGDNQATPVLLYKAGKNSTLDLTQNQGVANTYTGGTIIAGGEIIVNNANQLNAQGGIIKGWPIAILNGGRLHITSGGLDTNFWTPIKINTSGTPDTVKNCGSVIEVDDGVTATLKANFDFTWSPTGYLEKDGSGTLSYSAPAPALVPQGQGQANAWGLKLTAGLVKTNQMPVVSNSDSGPVIFNNGNLEVSQVPAGMVLDNDPAYGFRNIVSFQGTTSTVTVDDNAMFRTHGIVANEILGTVIFKANDADTNPSNNVVDLSRNMFPVATPISLGDYSRGNGTLIFQGVTVYMSGGGSIPSAASGAAAAPYAPTGPLNVLPHEAGFTLQLNDGVVFNASYQNYVLGAVNFNNVNPTNPVKIDGEEAIPPTPLLPTPPYYQFALTPDTWAIYGTGLTTWSGTTDKVGPGWVLIARSQGAPVTVNANALLKISGGTFEAGGTADPFTDTTTNLSLNIVNNSTATGLLISDGVKTVGTITGVGDTTVSGPAGTELIATSIVQNTLTIGSGSSASCTSLTPVPEPATWILLALAVAGMLSWQVSRSSCTKR